MDYKRVRELVLGKGFTGENFERTVEEYELLDVSFLPFFRKEFGYWLELRDADFDDRCGNAPIMARDLSGLRRVIVRMRTCSIDQSTDGRDTRIVEYELCMVLGD